MLCVDCVLHVQCLVLRIAQWRPPPLHQHCHQLPYLVSVDACVFQSSDTPVYGWAAWSSFCGASASVDRAISCARATRVLVEASGLGIARVLYCVRAVRRMSMHDAVGAAVRDDDDVALCVLRQAAVGYVS